MARLAVDPIPYRFAPGSRVTERQGSMSRPWIRSGVTRGEQHPTRPWPGNAPNVKLNVQRAFANAKAQTVEELEERINFQSVV